MTVKGPEHPPYEERLKQLGPPPQQAAEHKTTAFNSHILRNRCVKVKTRKKKEGSKEASPDPHREVSAQALPTRAPPLRTVRALRADADVAPQLLHGAVPDSLLVGGQPLRELDLRSLSGGGSHGPAAPHRAVPCHRHSGAHC